MTETDKVYIAVVETMKKYNINQAIVALQKYVTEGNSGYFTSTNRARQIIGTLNPADVMQDALISTLKYNMIAKQKGYVQEFSNPIAISKVIGGYYSGQQMAIPLSSADLNGLVRQMLKKNVGDTLHMLATNSELLNQFLTQYISIVCNNREDLNAISNEQFTEINNYFAKLKKPTLEQQNQR